jgi:hypothetical protein
MVPSYIPACSNGTERVGKVFSRLVCRLAMLLPSLQVERGSAGAALLLAVTCCSQAVMVSASMHCG